MVGEITATYPTAPQTTAGPQLRLEPGLEVQVKVSAVLPGNVVRLTSGTASVEVRVSAPLPQGAEVTLKVAGEAGKPQIQLLLPSQTGGQPAAAPSVPVSGLGNALSPQPSPSAGIPPAASASVSSTFSAAMTTSALQQPLTVNAAAAAPLMQALAAPPASDASALPPVPQGAASGIVPQSAQAAQQASSGSAGPAPVSASLVPQSASGGSPQPLPLNGLPSGPSVPVPSSAVPSPGAAVAAEGGQGATALSGGVPASQGVQPPQPVPGNASAAGTQSAVPFTAVRSDAAPLIPSAGASVVPVPAGAVPAGEAGSLPAQALPQAVVAANTGGSVAQPVAASNPSAVPLSNPGAMVGPLPAQTAPHLAGPGVAATAGSGQAGAPIPTASPLSSALAETGGAVTGGEGQGAVKPVGQIRAPGALQGSPAAQAASASLQRLDGQPGGSPLNVVQNPGSVPVSNAQSMANGPAPVTTAASGLVQGQASPTGAAPPAANTPVASSSPAAGALPATPASTGQAIVQGSLQQTLQGTPSTGSVQPGLGLMAATSGQTSGGQTSGGQTSSGQTSSGQTARVMSAMQMYVPSEGGAGAGNGSGKPLSESVKLLAGAVLPALEEQQASLADLFASLQAVSAGAKNGQPALPRPVQAVMEQILGLRLGASQAEPDTAGTGVSTSAGPGGASLAADLSAEEVQRAFELSGLFREAAVRQGKSPAGGDDLKSLLMNLRKLLQAMGGEETTARPLIQPRLPSLRGSPEGQPPVQPNLPGTEDGPEALASKLLKDTDGALSRIRLEQLASRGLSRETLGPQGATHQGASGAGGGSPAGHAAHAPAGRAMDVVVDLPLAIGGQTAVIQMQVGRDPDHKGEPGGEDRAWRLRFALELSATGPMEAAVSLRGGSTYVSLWADREEMHRALNENRESLQAAFADAGLDLQELRFIRGLPARRRFAAGASVDRQS